MPLRTLNGHVMNLKIKSQTILHPQPPREQPSPPTGVLQRSKKLAKIRNHANQSLVQNQRRRKNIGKWIGCFYSISIYKTIKL